MLKKLIKLNLEDLWLYFGVEGGIFLVMEIVIGCVMYFVRPGDSVTVNSVVLPITAGFISLVSGIGHVGISFDQALRFGQTRRRATLLTLGLTTFEIVCGLALAALLAAVERLAGPPLWAALSGADSWVRAKEAAAVPAYLAESGQRFIAGPNGLEPVAENTLIINVFTLDWYWWLLIFAMALAGGIIFGAFIQRFGSKGGWIIWGMCIAPTILGQLLPWKTYAITNWLWPLLAVLFVIGFLWSLWSMLHAVVRT